MTAEIPPVRPPRDRKKIDPRASDAKQPAQSKFWLFLSIALSTIILGWGLSLPFRQHDRPLLFWDESDIPRSDSAEVRKVRLSQEEAEAYRVAAIQRDREFLRARREKLRRNLDPNPPGAEDAARVEQARMEALKQTIEELRDAPPESLAGKYRQELEAALARGALEESTEPN